MEIEDRLALDRIPHASDLDQYNKDLLEKEKAKESRTLIIKWSILLKKISLERAIEIMHLPEEGLDPLEKEFLRSRKDAIMLCAIKKVYDDEENKHYYDRLQAPIIIVRADSNEQVQVNEISG